MNNEILEMKDEKDESYITQVVHVQVFNLSRF